MADTTTTNLLLTKPEVGASTDTWGTKINTDLDGVDAVFAAAGTGTSVGLNVGSGKKLKLVGDVIDTNGNELLKVTATASAVNEVTLANAATGGTPTFTASGDDTNIGMKFVGKGTGEVTAKVNGKDVFNASSSMGFKNRIINGAMVIDQRNAGASVNATNTAPYTVDRFYALQAIASSKFTVQQSSTAPTGFTKSVVITSSSAYTVLSSDYFLYRQVIEGFNIADLRYGSASAETITLSFWVRSSLTGTFGGALNNGGSNRSYPFSYTISAANTWEQKTITIAGDTTGTWTTDNTAGIVVGWSLGMGSTYIGTANAWASGFYGAPTGSTNLVSTNGATLYITGVQLEKGSTATSFDYRPYGTELALCQRYCQKIIADATATSARFATGFTINTTLSDFLIYLKTSMRITPSLTTTGTVSNYGIYTAAGGVIACSSGLTSPNAAGSTSEVVSLQVSVASGLTGGQGAMLLSNSSSTAYMLFTAEL